MIIQNRTVWFSLGYHSNSAAHAQRRNYMGTTANNSINRYDGEANISRGSGIPHGYRPPYTWILALEPKYGAIVTSIADLSVHAGMNGIGYGGTKATGLVGGKNATLSGGALQGTSSFTSSGKLIISAIATILGTGDIVSLSTLLSGKIDMVATLTGEGNIDGALGAIADMISTLLGSGMVTTEDSLLSAIGYMTATVSPFTDLSPQNLAAAVWNSILSNYLTPGSAGEALNGAGVAGDPWIATIETGMSAKEVLRILLSIAAGKTTINDLGGGSAIVKFRDINDEKDRVTASMDGSERTSMTIDAED